MIPREHDVQINIRIELVRDEGVRNARWSTQAVRLLKLQWQRLGGLNAETGSFHDDEVETKPWEVVVYKKQADKVKNKTSTFNCPPSCPRTFIASARPPDPSAILGCGG
ncbi:hypothetical protein N7467_007484 [Penicillium canescens]|nr:hypothetical protein N7467_007484 [Penicillium canescens]